MSLVLIQNKSPCLIFYCSIVQLQYVNVILQNSAEQKIQISPALCQTAATVNTFSYSVWQAACYYDYYYWMLSVDWCNIETTVDQTTEAQIA